jgi:uncharacterized protein YecE (DUF72 family)
MIRIGPAGWSYKDWEGVVYPKGRKIDQLAYLAEFFPTIEINNSFYRPIAPKVAEGWVRRAGGNPDFRFTAKLLQDFTHSRDKLTQAAVQEWMDGVRPILDAGRLGVALIQFPWSFKNEETERDYLVRLVEAFSRLPLVVEFRHASWDQDAVRDFLRGMKVGICNIDQPIFGRSIRPRSYATSKIGYFRCHGRNYKDWFREEAGRDARYNYLYSEEEVEQQSGLVIDLEQQTEDVYAVYNNHFRGQAVVNALQLKKKLVGTVDVPEHLATAYPDVAL